MSYCYDNEYPPVIIGPLPKYDESLLDDIIIDDDHYKHDTYGNITGYKNCILGYDSALYLEEIGIWNNINKVITRYRFGYSYYNFGKEDELMLKYI